VAAEEVTQVVMLQGHSAENIQDDEHLEQLGSQQKWLTGNDPVSFSCPFTKQRWQIEPNQFH